MRWGLPSLTNDELWTEREKITWDSYIHCITKIDISENQYGRNSLGEIFKYVSGLHYNKNQWVKSNITARDIVTIYYLQRKKRYRLLSTLGCFHWRKLEEVKLDRKNVW
jgi:hypothetical protein